MIVSPSTTRTTRARVSGPVGEGAGVAWAVVGVVA
jgi:hypothetical protein